MSNFITIRHPRLDAAGLSRMLATVAPALLAALIGMVMLAGIGFAQPETIHNATHDTRHATGFPCH